MFSANAAIFARPTVVGYAPIVTCSALVGGGIDNLDGLPVDGLAYGYVVGVVIGDTLGWWKWREKEVGEMEDQAAFVESDDDDEGIWVRIQ